MKKLIIVSLILYFNIFALDIREMNLDKVPSGSKLVYNISHTVDDGKTKKENNRGTLVIKVSQDRDVKGMRNYEFKMLNTQDRKETSLIFNSKDGGISMEDAKIIDSDGSVQSFSDSRKQKIMSLFDDDEVKIQENQTRINFDAVGRSWSCVERYGLNTRNKLTNKGKLVLNTDSNIKHVYLRSTERDTPLMLDYKKNVKTEQFAYHEGNPNFRFPNMNKRVIQKFHYKLVKFEK